MCQSRSGFGIIRHIIISAAKKAYIWFSRGMVSLVLAIASLLLACERSSGFLAG